MGVKSSVRLSIEEAAQKYAELKAAEVKKAYYLAAFSMDPSMLEDELAELNDKAAGGEGFENYIITY